MFCNVLQSSLVESKYASKYKEIDKMLQNFRHLVLIVALPAVRTNFSPSASCSYATSATSIADRLV